MRGEGEGGKVKVANFNGILRGILELQNYCRSVEVIDSEKSNFGIGLTEFSKFYNIYNFGYCTIGTGTVLYRKSRMLSNF